jgi:RimJ/RimL family protein N-acetyltransferase
VPGTYPPRSRPTPPVPGPLCYASVIVAAVRVPTVPEIRTERLLLRGFRDADREPFAAINASPVVMEHFPAPLDRDGSDAFVDRIDACWSERGWGLWAVEVPDVSSFVGYVGLWPAIYLDGPPVEVGWRLDDRVWGRGYAPEAAAAALEFAFDRLGLAEVVSFTVPQNRSSWRVMEKIGLRRDPDRDFDHPDVDPEAHPDLVRHVFYAIGADAWRASRVTAPDSPRK